MKGYTKINKERPYEVPYDALAKEMGDQISQNKDLREIRLIQGKGLLNMRLYDLYVANLNDIPPINKSEFVAGTDTKELGDVVTKLLNEMAPNDVRIIRSWRYGKVKWGILARE
jgi:hypothetical protein